MPPLINVSDSDIDSWIAEIHSIEKKLHADDDLIEKFEDWAKIQHRKVAPGFDASLGIMQPRKYTPESKQTPDGNLLQELDAAFGKVNIDSDVKS